MKPIFCFVAASLAAGMITVSGLPRDLGETVSTTRAFSQDGRWYSTENPADGDFFLRKKLRDMNLDVSRIPPEIMRLGDGIVEPLSEIPAKRKTWMTPVPSCLREEHVMQLASGNGLIAISFGKISASRDQARKTLSGSGWNLAGTKKSGVPFWFATIRNERETSFVLLEEKEGTYLSIRQLDK